MFEKYSKSIQYIWSMLESKVRSCSITYHSEGPQSRNIEGSCGTKVQLHEGNHDNDRIEYVPFCLPELSWEQPNQLYNQLSGEYPRQTLRKRN